MKLSLKAKLNILATLIFWGLAIYLYSLYMEQLKRFELPNEYLLDDGFYWYNSSVVLMEEDISVFIITFANLPEFLNFLFQYVSTLYIQFSGL